MKRARLLGQTPGRVVSFFLAVLFLFVLTTPCRNDETLLTNDISTRPFGKGLIEHTEVGATGPYR